MGVRTIFLAEPHKLMLEIDKTVTDAALAFVKLTIEVPSIA